MSNYRTIKRFSLEIEKIKRGQYPSFEEIQNFLLEHETEISPRTLQRDIESVRYTFGLVIKYDRHKNGYYVDEEVSLNAKSFYRYLELVNTAELLSESLRDSKDSLKYISFDTGGGLKGIENLKPLLFAIKNHRLITFDHNNYDTDQANKKIIKPYLLKEYNNRWYAVGYVDTLKAFRTFGIDRIENLDVLDKTFVPNPKLDPTEMFDKTIGVDYSQNKQQKVVLSFTSKQGKYTKSLPWHKSQAVLIDDNNEYRISLDIIPNYELTQKILMHGDTVKVLEPEWLVNKIKEKLNQSLQRYS